MAFTSIVESDLKDRGVTGLPDTPQLTTEEMQRKFDELAKEVLVPAFNRLVSELAKETAAANIGISVPEGLEIQPNIAAVIGWLLNDSGESDRLRHSHDNKSVLDLLTSDVKTGYDDLVSLLSSIKEISNVVKNSEISLPTGKAIVDYMISLGGGDMMRSVYDTNNSGVVDDSEKLGGKSPKFYLDTIEEVAGMAKNDVKSLIGDEYKITKDYLSGGYAIKDNVLYQFIQDKASGAWDETAVRPTTVEAELSGLNAKIAGVLLWENPNPTAIMPETTITLADANYDYYEVYYKQSTSSSTVMCQKSLKGYSTYLDYASIGGNGSTRNFRRSVTFVSETSMKISIGSDVIGTSQPTSNNNTCIPIRIIGYKS